MPNPNIEDLKSELRDALARPSVKADAVPITMHCPVCNSYMEFEHRVDEQYAQCGVCMTYIDMTERMEE